MTLRTRFTLWIGTLLAGTVAAAGGWIYVSEARALRESLERGRDDALAAFVQSARDAAVLHDDLAALNAAVQAGRAPSVRAAYLLDARGRVKAHSDTALAGREEPPTLPGDRRVTRSVVGRDGVVETAVLLVSPAAESAALRAALAPARRRIGAASLGALALGGLGAWVLAREVTRPLRVIALGTHRLAEGNLDHRVALRRDDELGALSRDFDRMAARLGELDAMKNDFVANVSHELRSPLAAIESYVNVMNEAVRAGRVDGLPDDLAVVRNNATRLGRFINDILDVAKIESRRMELDRRLLSAGRAFQEVVDLFAARAREREVALVVGTGAEVRLFADADRLQQILTNLVGNALKFTPSGGRVTLSAERAADGAVRLDVADTGPGLAPEDQARLFQRFVQGSNRGLAQGAKGTGLGLAIARGLAEAHGGSLTVAGALGRGCTFSVHLPAAP
jgi:signal transduction histidine kinase